MKNAEGKILVAILLLVGLSAGAASFTHVHDWTMEHSPTGTPGWFGWANAVISELVPVAALLEIRRRRRTGGATGYPLALLIGAAILSLSAQLAVAKPGASGWLLSALPALAFMGLVKLIFSATPAVPVEETKPTLVVAPPAPVTAPRPTFRPRPYVWTVPAGARLLTIVPRVAPAPAPVAPAPRPSGWVTAPGATLPIVPAVVEAVADEFVIPPAGPKGRPAEETRRLAAQLSALGVTKQEDVAARLGISRWALRTALAKTDDTPAPRRTRRVPALAHA